MAFASPSTLFPSLDSSVKVSQHFQCSICLDIYKDPVTTICGHTFCLTCLKRNSLEVMDCPLCKTNLGGSGRLNVNVVLKDLVEEELKTQQSARVNVYSGSQGEVPCDACPKKRKLKAIKSCLVCLSSYCEDHLGPHTSQRRLKGHKLVAPLADLDQRACLAHGRALELYRPKGKGGDGGWNCVCTLCVEEGDVVIPMETVWNRKKSELGKTKSDIKEKIQAREKKLREFQTLALDCKTHIDAEVQEVKGAFAEVMGVVRRAEEAALRPLEERRRRVNEEEQELQQELQKEIRRLEAIVKELSQLEDTEDHIEILQKCPSDPAPKEMKDWTDVTMDTDLSFGSLRNIHETMRAEIETELEKLTALELNRFHNFFVDVTLDPDTAHPQLIVSEDRREVSHGDERLDVPDGPMRYDTFGSVLGHSVLTSSSAYWEVEVGDKTGWDIGVASEEANRKGAISFKPSNGYWTLVLYGKSQYVALADPKVSLSLQEKPQRIGVFVDREEGLVSFYDAEVKGHIYSFTGCSFPKGLKLFPYFSPHLAHGEKNSVPLVISPVKTARLDDLT